MKNNLFIMIGVPGSGKTTFAEAQPKKIHISRDTIRFSLLNEHDNYFAKEKEVYKTFVNKINFHINNGEDVIADATHLNPKSRYKLLNQLHINRHKTNIIAIYVNTPIEACLERNNLRKGTKTYVPPNEIYNMYARLEPPTYNEPFDMIFTYINDQLVPLKRN